MSVAFDQRMILSLRAARRVAVLTGAGVSAESGVPTFRDAQTGLWARFRPEELATPEAFRRNPQLVWGWYEWRRGLVARAEPNAGHLALARLEKLVPEFALLTQNVDGLHQRAGSRAVTELHGNIQRNKCSVQNCVIELASSTACLAWRAGSRGTDTAQSVSAEFHAQPPACPRCGAPVRPDVVWFGEGLPAQALAAAERAARECDVFLSIGTSAVVFPAAQLPVSALESGATVIEVNRDPTPISPIVHFHLRGAAGEILPALVDAAWSP